MGVGTFSVEMRAGGVALGVYIWRGGENNFMRSWYNLNISVIDVSP